MCDPVGPPATVASQTRRLSSAPIARGSAVRRSRRRTSTPGSSTMSTVMATNAITSTRRHMTGRRRRRTNSTRAMPCTEGMLIAITMIRSLFMSQSLSQAVNDAPLQPPHDSQLPHRRSLRQQPSPPPRPPKKMRAALVSPPATRTRTGIPLRSPLCF